MFMGQFKADIEIHKNRIGDESRAPALWRFLERANLRAPGFFEKGSAGISPR